MDSFSAEAELVNIHTAFYQSLFDKVIGFDTSGFAASNQLAASLLKLRARLGLRQYDDVLAELATATAKTGPEHGAVEITAQYLKAVDGGDSVTAAAAVEKAAGLSQAHPESADVQLLAGTVLAAAGRPDEAVAALGPHRGKIDVVGLLVQIYLLQNRLDLAKAEVEAAREWAQDNVVVNLAEAWVYLREGGDHYQSAFYVFEEVTAAAGVDTAASLVGQAVANLHLGRLDEAAAALDRAHRLAGPDGDVGAAIAANRAVLDTLAGRSPAADPAADPTSSLGRDLAEKRAEFGVLAAEYRASVGGAS